MNNTFQQRGSTSHLQKSRQSLINVKSRDNYQLIVRGVNEQRDEKLQERITAGEFNTVKSVDDVLKPVADFGKNLDVGPGRFLSLQINKWRRQIRNTSYKPIPVARGDIRELAGKPFFIPLEDLYYAYGGIFRLSFGVKDFLIVSDANIAKQMLLTDADHFSKGILSEILEFVMGTGLIPANGEVWKAARRAVVPAIHRKYVEKMLGMFGDTALHGAKQLEIAAESGKDVELENYFSRYALDVIGKAVFNYDFDSLQHDDPVIQAVYTTLREAEHRSLIPFPYWNLPFADVLVPRQAENKKALAIINDTLEELVAECRRLVEEEDVVFDEEFLSDRDPSILHFLLASGNEITSKQLRDDLVTMLIAGHETSAAVLTWMFSELMDKPDIVARMREEIDRVIGDRTPGIEDLKQLKYVTRVICESMRMYPQPPVLIRRALKDIELEGHLAKEGTDFFISVWNLHRSEKYWDKPNEFNPDRFPLDEPVPNEQTHNYAYLPFGGGRRKCVGDQFALFEMVSCTAMLLRRYDFAYSPDAPEVLMTTGATIHTKNGLLARVTKRKDYKEEDMELVGQAAKVVEDNVSV